MGFFNIVGKIGNIFLDKVAQNYGNMSHSSKYSSEQREKFTAAANKINNRRRYEEK